MLAKVLGMVSFAIALVSIVSAAMPDALDRSVDPVRPNVTVIHKTKQNWPVRGQITMQPCKFRACHTA